MGAAVHQRADDDPAHHAGAGKQREPAQRREFRRLRAAGRGGVAHWSAGWFRGLTVSIVAVVWSFEIRTVGLLRRARSN
ncbi:MAG TPA: hypothetical protein VL049_24685 [Candidatus Dormibacteraeota bacterium]|nr:hypothetical protein [Candidatus Dormibacteraeota bacterium]